MTATDTRALDRRCLVVEDDWMAAMMLEETLEELGFEVIGPVASNAQAMVVVEVAGDALDGAVLDVNLSGDRVYPVADALAARGIPFVFVTGYGSEQLETRYAGVPVVQKPYTLSTLEPALETAFAARSDRPL